MKKWILRIGIAFVAALVLVAIFVFTFLNDIVKRGVEKVGPQLTKTDVRLASSKLSPLSGDGHIKGLFIGNPEGFKTESAIKVGDMKLEVDLGSLFSDVVVIEKMHIEGPEITFEGGLTGNNLRRILDNIESATGTKEEDPSVPTPGEPQKKFRAQDIQIKGGRIHLSVTGLGGRSATVPLPDIHLQNIGSDVDGATLAQLTREVLEPIIREAIKAAGGAITQLGKELPAIGKDAVESTEKAVKGIKDLFKKE